MRAFYLYSLYLFCCGEGSRFRNPADSDEYDEIMQVHPEANLKGFTLEEFVALGADTHVARLALARAAARQLGTDAVDVVLLNTAPLSLVGRVLTTRRWSTETRLHDIATSLCGRGCFKTLAFREHRLLAERQAHG